MPAPASYYVSRKSRDILVVVDVVSGINIHVVFKIENQAELADTRLMYVNMSHIPEEGAHS
jgi:hypothetical protein